MRIDYITLSPTGNITVLILSPVDRRIQPSLARELLDPSRLGGEQVGYVESASHPGAVCRLQMMGGEFCGNASMSLGAVLARNDNLQIGEERTYILEVSGSEALVPCRIARTEGGYIGTVQMPVPEAIGDIQLGPLSATRIDMPGITHLMLPAEAAPSVEELKTLLPQWNESIRAEALGALIWDEDKQYMDPIVYVPSAGTIVREHGCGSGSAAVGSAIARAHGITRLVHIHQPGGTIDVQAEYQDGRIPAVSITGKVEILQEGTINILLR